MLAALNRSVHLLAISAAVLALLPASGSATTALTPAGAGATAPRPPLVRASVTSKHGRPLPPSYLGLSTESWDVPGLDANPAALRRVLMLLRVPGDGPVSLRIGGQSTEQTYWNQPDLGPGPDNYHPGSDWLATLASMTRAAHLKLILDLNLVADSPSMAAGFARSALAALPRRSVTALDIGNEPDIGHRMVPNPLAPPGPVPSTPQGWDQYTESAYLARYAAYVRAISAAVPEAAIAGPDSYFPKRTVDWMRRMAAMRSPKRLAMLTVHRYALASCANPAWHDYASIPHLLASYTTGGLANSVKPAVALASRVKLPLRISEFNSVTCGGSNGVSDTFATALWAADALFSMWNVGVDGVNLHIQLGAPNAPFSISPEGIGPRPLLYGMLMFARAVGPGAQLVRVHTVGTRAPHVRVWAVRTIQHHLLKVLVLDKGAGPVRLVLKLPGRGPATEQRLIAPAVDATSGETLAGQALSPQARWLGRRSVQRVRRRSWGGYTLAIPAYSETLITTGS